MDVNPSPAASTLGPNDDKCVKSCEKSGSCGKGGNDSVEQLEHQKELEQNVPEEQANEDELAQLLQDELKLGADATPKQTLILLDFNNMLVFRDKSGEIAGKPDYSVRFSKYWMRPYAREFICRLLNDPRCKVAIYTSIQRKNMEPVILGFDKYFLDMEKAGKFEPILLGKSVVSSYSTLYDSQIALFDQPYNVKDPSMPDEWETMRDLRKIWAHKIAKDNGFDQTNTLMIEGDLRKVRNWKQNSVIVKECLDHRNKTDDTLMKLADYVSDVVLTRVQTGETIPDIISKHPMAQA